MLLDRATGLTAKILQYQKLVNAANEASHFATRANQFSDVANRLTRTQTDLASLEAAGIHIAFKPTDSAALAGKARTLRDLTKENPGSLNDPPFNLKYDFTDRLLSIGTAASKAMNAAWKNHVDESSKLGSEDVLNALEALPQFRESITKIRQCRSKIALLADSLPEDPVAAVAQLSALVSQHRAAWSEMTADGIPAAVIAFLRSCAAEGAALTSLTEEVHVWLESRDLLSAFRIRIR
jgi:hypothetical protein